MMAKPRKPRIAVVSPFLDKQHGTERRVLEQLDALADKFEFHMYSSLVDDLDLKKVVWHRRSRDSWSALAEVHMVFFREPQRPRIWRAVIADSPREQS